jgi:antitoxin VapB
MKSTAKVFRSGNSQAVRLPKELRFPPETSEVSIRKNGTQIILEPFKREEWPESFWEAFGEMPRGFTRPGQTRQARVRLDT